MEATLYTADELHSLLQIYVIYAEASSSCCGEHFWHDNYPINRGNNKILCNPFAVP